MYRVWNHEVPISPPAFCGASSASFGLNGWLAGLATLQTHTQTQWENATRNKRLGHQLQVDVKFIEPIGQTGKR